MDTTAEALWCVWILGDICMTEGQLFVLKIPMASEFKYFPAVGIYRDDINLCLFNLPIKLV